MRPSGPAACCTERAARVSWAISTTGLCVVQMTTPYLRMARLRLK